MPFSNFWAVIFFTMMIFLGIDTQVLYIFYFIVKILKILKILLIFFFWKIWNFFKNVSFWKIYVVRIGGGNMCSSNRRRKWFKFKIEARNDKVGSLSFSGFRWAFVFLRERILHVGNNWRIFNHFAFFIRCDGGMLLFLYFWLFF